MGATIKVFTRMCRERPLVLNFNMIKHCTENEHDWICLYSTCRAGYQTTTRVRSACAWTSNTSTAPPGLATTSEASTHSVIAAYAHTV